MPTREDVPNATLAQSLWRGVPRAYAVLFFSPDPRLGWSMLLASLFTPGIGLPGLAGAATAGAIAWCLGFDRARIRNGYLLFNPLLVCLTLGLMQRSYFFPPAVLAVLWIAAVLGGLFSAIALQQAISQHFGLSAQSLPAMASAYVLYFLAFAIAGPATMPVESANVWLDLAFIPEPLQGLLRVLGAMVFEPHAAAGLIVLSALVMASPIAALLAVLAYATGTETLQLLGAHVGADGAVWCGFNFLLCGIALGSSYFAPSRASLLLAMMGAFLCALVTIALATALRYFGLPASALPYNLVVLVLVYALRQRTTAAGLHPTPAPGMLPETAGRLVVLNAARFPHLHLPALDLPFKDRCIITQGVDGALTHRGLWRWALDFEVLGHDHGAKMPRPALEDYPTFNKPVLAPCTGTVAAVKSDVHDNAPGENNPADNWGNYVVIFSDAGFYVMLAHLRRSSLRVGSAVALLWASPSPGAATRVARPFPICTCRSRTPPHPRPDPPLLPAPPGLSSDPPSPAPLFATSAIPAEGRVLSPPRRCRSCMPCSATGSPATTTTSFSATTSPPARKRCTLISTRLDAFACARPGTARNSAPSSRRTFLHVDYEGPADSILAFIAACLARVPGLADPAVTWYDHVSPAPFHRRFARKLHDLIDPYLGPELLSYRYALITDEDGFEVHSELVPGTGTSGLWPVEAPQRIVTKWPRDTASGAVQAWLAHNVEFRAEMVAPRIQPPRPESKRPSIPAAFDARPIRHENAPHAPCRAWPRLGGRGKIINLVQNPGFEAATNGGPDSYILMGAAKWGRVGGVDESPRRASFFPAMPSVAARSARS